MDDIDRDNLFDNAPSLSASLEDFDPGDPRRPAFFGIASTNSAFRSEDSDYESEAASRWDPPGAKWYSRTHSHLLDPLRSESPPCRSREPSPLYESAVEGDLTLPMRIPLPESPQKLTPRNSPERDLAGATDHHHHMNGTIHEPAQAPENSAFRVRVLAEYRHRNDPFESSLTWCRDKLDLVAGTRTSMFFSVLVLLSAATFLRVLFSPPTVGPVPDLVTVAGFARNLEPLIYYSENGQMHFEDLQETSVAVWDLGESVRSTNMTSAPIIYQELDELSETLKTLALELTRFFANVDGDIDSILVVMEWAKRELSQVSTMPVGRLTAAAENLHGALCRVGILEKPDGSPTQLGQLVKDLFGPTTQQRSKEALHRTFNEFIGRLEESISEELMFSTRIFSLFESIDRLFLNLQRTVIREVDNQNRESDELLSSLWSRVMGANSGKLRKFSRNQDLLKTLRDKTVNNKLILSDHNSKLLQLKSNLEFLRKKLVSPLVRSNSSSTITIEEQIRGLQRTHDYMSAVRQRQKEKVMELMFGARGRRVTITSSSSGDSS